MDKNYYNIKRWKNSHFLLVTAIVINSLFLFQCKNDEINSCGNSVIDVGEECDSEELNNNFCQTLGFYGGKLSCTDKCKFDTSDCESFGFCGDTLIQPLYENCEGNNLQSESCNSLGYSGGTLSCGNDCRYLVSGCTGGELCGDGSIQDPEQCDGENINNLSCEDFDDFTGGTLKCGSDCRYDFSLCFKEFCGDGTAQSSEQCDTGDLSEQTCESLGYGPGTLKCNSSCRFDISECTGDAYCGDGIIQGNEDCDSNNLAGKTCSFFGFISGTLSCSDSCVFDTSNCSNTFCGDGIKQASEECDLEELSDQTCESLGFELGGVLSCNNDCSFNTEQCLSADLCGNGTIDNDEECDGNNFNNNSCESLGYLGGGLLSCNSNCTVNVSECLGTGICGDGIVQPDETCDGTNMGSSTCMELNGFFGSLTCNDECEIEGTCNDTFLWGSSGSDYSTMMTIDPYGNMYIAGITTGNLDGQVPFGGNDGFISKLSPVGNLLWTKLLGTSSTDGVNGIAIDSNGKITVTGPTYGHLDGNTNSGDSDIFIVQYDSNGAKLGTLLVGTSNTDVGNAISVDSNNNIYVTGDAGQSINGETWSGGADILLIKFDTSRNIIWTRLLGTSGIDSGKAIALDSTGNIFITGSTDRQMAGQTHYGGKDIFCAKYDSNGNLLWNRQFGTALDELGRAISVSPAGDVYITGTTQGSLDSQINQGDNDIFLIKYDTNGNRIWTKQWGTTHFDTGYAVASNSSEITVAGTVSNSLDGLPHSGLQDVFITRFLPDGTQGQSNQWGSNADDAPSAISYYFDHLMIFGHSYGNFNGESHIGYFDLFLLFVD
ncbi:MAG: SBBP repeat-containing protein [Deltaproteobacteria bacterium]|nr:SBBP repeat-containing protein [Deltaproteobacteria bacterium]